MQATLDAKALKPFTKALSCISRYGDEMIIHAGPDSLVLTSMNQPKTAFCSITYSRTFFRRYSIAQSRTQASTAAGPSHTTGGRVSQNEQPPTLKCQLQTKALLSILRHKNTEKSTEKCEFTIIDGVDTPEEEVREDEDTLESRLIVRLHCKHGIVKTHRLLLNNPTNDDAPAIRSGDNESRLVVQSYAVKEMIEHFPNAKGPRSDPELIWRFDDNEVKVKSMEKGIDAKGKSQLVTELTLGPGEFDVYDIMLAPLTIGFFLREFNAAITLADALLVPVDMRFTRSAEPVYISAETDVCAMLFVIATNQVRGEDGDAQPRNRASVQQKQSHGSHRSASGVPAARKRPLEEDVTVHERTRSTAPDMRRPSAAQQNERRSQRTPPPSRSQASASVSWNNFDADADAEMDDLEQDNAPLPPGSTPERPPTQSQPLFLASQLSAADVDAIRASGLGIEDMDAEEFAAMLDEEGEEVNIGGPPPAIPSGRSASRHIVAGAGAQGDDLDHDEFESEFEMGPTQPAGRFGSSRKAFRPLFED
ncbi:hypothetical protein M0805_005737 [Coniferiporia weirii]|nr:hypothetical protein M0805_005737 [Coniferiporia weirii]